MSINTSIFCTCRAAHSLNLKDGEREAEMKKNSNNKIKAQRPKN